MSTSIHILINLCGSFLAVIVDKVNTYTPIVPNIFNFSTRFIGLVY